MLHKKKQNEHVFSWCAGKLSNTKWRKQKLLCKCASEDLHHDEETVVLLLGQPCNYVVAKVVHTIKLDPRRSFCVWHLAPCKCQPPLAPLCFIWLAGCGMVAMMARRCCSKVIFIYHVWWGIAHRIEYRYLYIIASVTLTKLKKQKALFVEKQMILASLMRASLFVGSKTKNHLFFKSKCFL